MNNNIMLLEIILTVATSTGLILVTMYIFNKTAGKLASGWVESEFNIIKNFNIDEYFEKNREEKSSNDAHGRIKLQYLYAKEKAIQHFKIMLHFQVRYYTVINMTAICGIFTAIFAFVIMNSGWDNSGNIIKSLFFVFSAATTYSGAFPRFFAHKSNIFTNKTKSIGNRLLMNRIETFLSTGFDSSGEKCTIEKFIVRVDNVIEELADYPVSLEMDKKFNPDNVLNRLK